MSTNWTNKSPSEYEGKMIEENHKLKEHLKWCLVLLEAVPIEPSHKGGCSPPMTPCDGACSDSYYFHKTLDEIRKSIN